MSKYAPISPEERERFIAWAKTLGWFETTVPAHAKYEAFRVRHVDSRQLAIFYTRKKGTLLSPNEVGDRLVRQWERVKHKRSAPQQTVGCVIITMADGNGGTCEVKRPFVFLD